jgi:hypothetical protein
MARTAVSSVKIAMVVQGDTEKRELLSNKYKKMESMQQQKILLTVIEPLQLAN